jgi:hypothetical protein
MAQTDNKRLYIMLGILGVLFVYLILSKTVFAKKDEAKTQSPVPMVNNISTIVPETVSKNRKMVMNKINNINYVVPKFPYEGNWQSDPFFYLNQDSLNAIRDRELGQYTSLRLNGISLLRDEGYSLINTVIMTDTDTVMTASILKEGDEFDGFRVVKIAFDHVILRKGSRNIRLELDES